MLTWNDKSFNQNRDYFLHFWNGWSQGSLGEVGEYLCDIHTSEKIVDIKSTLHN